ncbi:hypothetical protein HS088_TW06G00308 [Tripterygium wilfordii]|uniref:Uncharacterized protein n=1 Tax=Tripterygium wilfordii TaxID=458696 RepID=A0A7J7DIK7_TRIWF|nr:hypothetical protein HS088_TW06G00308 [Tripterygium wilfordii]
MGVRLRWECCGADLRRISAAEICGGRAAVGVGGGGGCRAAANGCGPCNVEDGYVWMDPSATNPGPIESSVLYDQDKHVSSAVWEGQISGLREISYLADSFATKGLDPQQFESISRIRFISQECLRDQTGSPITSSAAPQIEAGKRVRGKERVRRKSSGKRRRKDDQMEFPEASDDQSQFCSPVIEVDQFQLRQVDGEIGELQICTDGEFEPLQPSHAAGVGNNAELCDVSHKFDDSPLCDADDGHRSAFLSDAVKKVDDMQLGNETNEVNTSQLCYMETKEVDDFQPHDVTNGVNGEQFCDPITTEMDYSQPGDAAVNDPQLHNVIEAKDSQLYDPTNNVDESLSHLADESEPTTTQPAVEVPELSLENMEDVVQQEDKSIIV